MRASAQRRARYCELRTVKSAGLRYCTVVFRFLITVTLEALNAQAMRNLQVQIRFQF
jgi:hypothetical protein